MAQQQQKIPRNAAMRQAEAGGFVDIEGMLARVPPIGEQTAESITDNTNAINSACEDPRMKFVFESLTRHLHDFAREVKLTTAEWQAACDFLTECGQISDESRHEFILLSDIFGLETLVDSLDNPRPKGCTESTILGPFHTPHARDHDSGADFAKHAHDKPLLVKGRVTNAKGEPIGNARIEAWETDEEGFYDVQYDSKGPDCRGVVRTNPDGYYAFRGIVPATYPIQTDGPVGRLLLQLNRHCFRPAHLHFFVDAPGYEHLTTAVYPEGDAFINSDTVFGVKESLKVKLVAEDDGKLRVLHQDFVLPTVEAVAELKRELAQGVKVKPAGFPSS